MKIAVLNYSGNVGKTTIARDVLSYRLPDYEMISVESVNSDGKESLVIRGEDGDKIYTEVILNDNLIMDVGSSNLEAFLRSGEKESEIINSIDIFIVPVTPEKKQQADTIKTIRDLLLLGVKPTQINIIFNQVDDTFQSNIDEIFATILSAHRELGISVDTKNMIFRHDLYSQGQKLSEMMSSTDYRAKMENAKKSGKMDEARKWASRYVRQKKIMSLDERYESIFRRLIGTAS